MRPVPSAHERRSPHTLERAPRRQPRSDGPGPVLVESGDLLPDSGIVLDVAGGTGRNALWLAAAGLTVTLVDVSEVALDIARTEAVAFAGLLD